MLYQENIFIKKEIPRLLLPKETGDFIFTFSAGNAYLIHYKQSQMLSGLHD